MTLIQARDIHKTLGTGARATQALQGCTFTAMTGEFIAISGKSGSGKTTLLRCLCGLARPDSGDITIAGRDITALSASELLALRRETIGVVHQGDGLIAELTVEENVTLVLAAAGLSAAHAQAGAAEALDAVGIAKLKNRFPHEISRGQAQRVGIARAISGTRQIVLADEPTSALDTTNSHAVCALFRSLCESGITVVVASHDPIVLGYSDRAFLLADGTLNPHNPQPQSIGGA